MVVIYPWFVCHEQNWLVYHPVLSVIDNNGWYFSKFFLSWTKLAVISTGFVCRGQYWLVYFTDVSCLNNIGR